LKIKERININSKIVNKKGRLYSILYRGIYLAQPWWATPQHYFWGVGENYTVAISSCPEYFFYHYCTTIVKFQPNVCIIYLFTIAALAIMVFKVSVMSVSASYESLHEISSGKNLIFKMLKNK